MKFYINPPTVNNPDLTPLLNVEGPIEVYDVWELFREDIIKFLEDLPNEVTYHTADGNLKNDKLKIVYDPKIDIVVELIGGSDGLAKKIAISTLQNKKHYFNNEVNYIISMLPLMIWKYY